MSDSKQNADDGVVELDDLLGESTEDLEELFESQGDELENTKPDEQGSKLGLDSGVRQERFWVIIIIGAFSLALLTSLILVPMVATQQQRVDRAAEIVSAVNLTTASAAQALTVTGSYDPMTQNLAQTEATVNNLTVPESFIGTAADKIFGNGSSNNGLSELWVSYKTAAEQFLGNQEQVNGIKSRTFVLTNNIANAVNGSIRFVEAVAKEGRNKGTGKSKDKYLFLTSEAANLNGILGRLGTTMRGYFQENSNLAQLSDAQNGLMIRLRDTLNRIVSNSAAVVGTAAEALQADYQQLESGILELGGMSSSMTSSRATLAEMRQLSEQIINASEAAENQTQLVKFLSQTANFLPILFALIGAYALWRFFRLQSRDLVAQEANLSVTLADQQESILKLLDEMSALADGDLTVEAEVTDQITGAIADSVNFAVIEMRELVSQINRASLEVANESELAVNSAQSVSQSNMQQADEITAAAQLMKRVSTSMREMSEQATNSSAMAAESIKAATDGAGAVRDTIRGMEDMREQIQDTSKRIKRLGESSQRIGDIVALIDDIAEQTNILSLNAAIQASMAGEAGRGFAVVSDEVQSLAERSTEATKKIGELVTTIQNDTNDAVLSMEKATQQVVAGTKVADSAGGALSAIEDVSKRLSGLIGEISKGSNEQAEVVTRVSEQVDQISKSSTGTSRKAQESANSIAKLLELAKELEASVSRFKLPAS